MLYSALAERNWEQVTASVVGAKIITGIGQAGDTYRRHLEYHIEIQYEYNNKTFINNSYSIGTGSVVKGGWTKKKEVKEWLKNRNYSCFYNPRFPFLWE